MPTIPAALSTRLTDLLSRVYREHDADALCDDVIAAFWPEGEHPRARTRRPEAVLWSQKDSVLITYGDSLMDGKHKPLDVLLDFLKENMAGVVNGVHILPFFPFTSDDGFAVTDYRKVNPSLGDWPDIQRIGKDFHLMSDLVLNHVSSQSPWFNDYRQGKAPYDQFFFEASPEDDLTPVVRPRTTPLLQEVETAQGLKHVWCTFSHDQVDLNFRNPEVLLEMIRIIRLHMEMGVRIIRLDAVAFLWKEPSTPSIHLPQTHAIVQLLRVLTDFAAEPVVLLTETNVPKAENLSYFAQSNEAHWIYNFPLPPLILHAMLSGEAKYLSSWSRAMPPAPVGCAYLNFTASHDGIGMRPAEGLLPDEEIARMIQTVQEAGGLASMRALPGGGTAVYELNTTYFSAVARTYKGYDDHQIARFLCSQTIVMSLEGVPAFYVHAMLATENDRDGVERRGMNRAINRHRWDYPALKERLMDEDSDQTVVMAALSERIKTRADQPAFHPNAVNFTLSLDPRVFGVWRQSLDRSQSIFALHNVSAEDVMLSTDALNLIADVDWVDLLSGETIAPDGEIAMAPYQCRWITNRA